MRRDPYTNFDVLGADRHAVLSVDDDHDAIVGNGPVVSITNVNGEPGTFQSTFMGVLADDNPLLRALLFYPLGGRST